MILFTMDMMGMGEKPRNIHKNNSKIYNHSYITMRTATTKIPHLLYEKYLLKNPEWNVGLYLQLMIYLQLILYDEDGRKTPKYIKKRIRI